MDNGIYTVGLVGCTSQKLKRPAPARELYVSSLFKKASAFAERSCDRWYVLSAKHGLLHPFLHFFQPIQFRHSGWTRECRCVSRDPGLGRKLSVRPPGRNRRGCWSASRPWIGGWGGAAMPAPLPDLASRDELQLCPQFYLCNALLLDFEFNVYFPEVP